MRPSFLPALSLACLLLASPATRAIAGGVEFVRIDGEAIVASCEALGEEDYEKALYFDGDEKTRACLESAIIEHVSLLVKSEALDRESTAALLDRIRSAEMELFSAIYEHDRYCDPACGSFSAVPPYRHVVESFEGILRIVIARRDHELP